jgi:hypothetical protein
MLLQLPYYPQFCVTEFLKCNFSEIRFLLHYQYVLNTAEELHYILNIVWHKNLIIAKAVDM